MEALTQGKMKNLIRLFIVFTVIIGIFTFGINGCSKYEKILRVKDRKKISFNQMIKEIKDKKIILIGELHNNYKHHTYQLQIIKALHERGIQIAVGLEMFRATNQKELDRWVSGNVTLKEFLPLYYDNWSFPWPLYKDIFLFSGNKKIPLIGLNVPSEITTKVAQRGFSSLTKQELAQLPPGIRCHVDPTYMESIKKAYSIHDTGKNFINFCEAQLTWDNVMALHTLEYLKSHPRYTVLLLTGMSHAWKRAIPEQIKRLNSGYSVSVILPEVPDETPRDKISFDEADYLILNESGS